MHFLTNNWNTFITYSSRSGILKALSFVSDVVLNTFVVAMVNGRWRWILTAFLCRNVKRPERYNTFQMHRMTTRPPQSAPSTILSMSRFYPWDDWCDARIVACDHCTIKYCVDYARRLKYIVRQQYGPNDRQIEMVIKKREAIVHWIRRTNLKFGYKFMSAPKSCKNMSIRWKKKNNNSV